MSEKCAIDALQGLKREHCISVEKSPVSGKLCFGITPKGVKIANNEYRQG